MTVEISAQYVKELRSMTGAGMMDCKKALQQTDGNLDKAIEVLRQKGLASASKKSGRKTAEGLIESYIHAGSKIGVMVEINCETDFVARRSEFHNLAKNIAMQIAASPQVEYVDLESIPQSIINKEKLIEAGKDDILKKPKAVQEQIIDGRVKKRLNELSLLDQTFIRNNDITVRDLINENIALMGENIQVRRFVRFLLGQGITNTSPSFSEEVANMIKS
uniref:Multifunctional fusion protein n=1 Tax=Trichogloeopsis pedicellata TaxID=1495610 RepID=A0A1G4P0Q7_9FLOR|nr:Translation elongation factor Ts [Trichogloeopsis pedicellata]SCW24406.1 Translation elongation factor Ts [Trichogloeopsis pedicellata]